MAHGFRSSFRDWAAEETDHPGEVIKAALAHVVHNKVELAYREPARLALVCLYSGVFLRSQHRAFIGRTIPTLALYDGNRRYRATLDQGMRSRQRMARWPRPRSTGLLGRPRAFSRRVHRRVGVALAAAPRPPALRFLSSSLTLFPPHTMCGRPINTGARAE